MSDRPLQDRWATLQHEGRTALIPYLTAGYPSRDRSLDALRMVVDAGADFVEVGIPFSDPLADGPIIQQSTHQALANGMTVPGVLELVAEAALGVPVIAFGYLNPLLAYGFERFLRDAAEVGVQGLLLTDLPLGEDRAIEDLVRASALSWIPLVAPTTEPGRAKRVLADADGFVYVISRMGVTGAQTELDDQVENIVNRVRGWTDLPVALGFGIATGLQAAVAARYADGVVVGSALVHALDTDLECAHSLMVDLRSAIDAL